MKMTIGKKLFTGFFGVLFILSITIGISYIQIHAVDDEYTDLIDDKAKKLIMIKGLDALAKKEQVGVRGYLLLGDDTALNSFNEAHDKYVESSKYLNDIITHPEAKKIVSELDEVEEEYYQFSQQVFELKRQNKTTEYTDLVSGQGREIIKRFDERIDKLTNYQQGLYDVGSKDAANKVKDIIILVVTLGILAIFVGVAIAIYMGRIISKPVVLIANSAEKIAAGDLTIENIKVKSRDEIGQLAKAFNTMSSSLRGMIKRVGANAEHLAASAEELTASTEQTNRATEHIAGAMQEVAVNEDKQVESVEETSQTINEMSIGIQQIASNAQNVSASAIDAAEKALEGGHSIETSVNQMNKINETVNGLSEVVVGLGERSKEIGQILDVITDIASQTNLLALNAAIEAARAGEHGQGFAVVADEVRKLSEQSSQSANQISQLITAIQAETNHAVQSMTIATNEVRSGIEVVNTAGRSFEEIEGSINEVTTQIQEVSSATQQMAAGSEQMVQSMKNIAESSESAASSTQRVSAATEEQQASMEEITASANSLTKMAEELQSLIGEFRI